MGGIQLATFIIAAYGAVLSTLLLVKGTRGIAVYCKMATGGMVELVVIEAVNKRARPVTITQAGLRMNNGYSFTQVVSTMGQTPLPKKLDFGDVIAIYFDLSELEKVMAEKRPAGVTLTRAFVRDAEGKEYASRLPRRLKDKGFAK
ncbi:MAG: hypothetical protein ABSG25_08815 [Bryobacteraceae bacterium]